MATKQALCVGGTSGIGRALAIKFASQKFNVSIMGRSEEAGKEIIEEMKKLNPEGKFEMIKVDASLMKDIEKVCEEYKQNHDRLDYCVLSQGIASMNGRTETKEGIDVKLALHYYGRVMFVRQLQDLLRLTSKNSDVRVLTVLSAGVHSPYTKLDDLDLKHNFTLKNAADAAGFYNDLAMDQLSKEEGNQNIAFIHQAPGIVATQWGRDFPTVLRWACEVVKVVAAKSPEKYAEYTYNALSSDSTRKGFHLLNQYGEPASVTKSHTDNIRETVWKHTVELLNKALGK
ncbi:FabG domain-containing protein [Naegleria gruberi]|uniref:FabG domain-containing protein n=1 Tax=Naegleria gruberi TaxID=5762 RepID=D2VW68_NAEGR|nr:FabG domain-containing protein [Naegleria gruberi]EFC38962.1 FabG domain-containing protein [Naegleria gruberi]|eukprot:XP_002671706.1 FabG domain-containing protein [Naegleria gruberi strain NEG-M]